MFPYVPSDLKQAYDSREWSEKYKDGDPLWYPWDVASGYMFRFPCAERADAFLMKQVDDKKGAFAVTDDTRPYLYGNFTVGRLSALRNTVPIHRGLWVTLIRAYGQARMWYTILTDSTDPFSMSLRHMTRLTEDSVRAGSAITLLSLSTMG